MEIPIGGFLIKYYTVCDQERPVRLSEATRRFAWESLRGKYGDLAMQTLDVSMDGVEGFEEMTEHQ